MSFTAAILIGGACSRMNGQAKYLLEIDGLSILNRQIEVLRPLFDHILVVGKKLPDLPSYITLVDDYFETSGPLSGIHAALEQAATDYVFVLSSDMPFISGSLIGKMKEKILMSHSDILLPRHVKGIEPLHGFYNNTLSERAAIILQSGKRRIRELFSFADVAYYDIPEDLLPDELFFNINYPEDYLKALIYAARIKQRGCCEPVKPL